MSGEKIQFLEYQKPGLESGDYSIQVQQKIRPKDADADKTFNWALVSIG